MKPYTIAALAFVLSLSTMATSVIAGDFRSCTPAVIPARRTNSLLARTVPGKRLYLLPARESSRSGYGYYDAKLPVADRRGVIKTRVPVKFVDFGKPVCRYRFGRPGPDRWMTVHPRQDPHAGKGACAIRR